MDNQFLSFSCTSSSLDEQVRGVSEFSKLLLSTAPFSRPIMFILRGTLGSGKTTFVQALAKSLDVQSVVDSPTFSYVQQYDCGKKLPWDTLVHADLYRLEDASRVLTLGIDDAIRDARSLVLVEWGERLLDWFLEFDCDLYILDFSYSDGRYTVACSSPLTVS